jgi:hypothetical protein
MLMMNERRPAVRTLRGWAISVLQEAGAIRECEEHGWMQDRDDPHSRERALVVACQDPPFSVSRMRLLPRSRTSWTRLAIPARSVRPITARLLPFPSCYAEVVPIAGDFRQATARLIHSRRSRPLAGTASFMAASPWL